MVDIPKIKRDPFGHLLKVARFSAQSIDLRPTRNSRLDLIATVIFCNLCFIFEVVGKRMRPRADQGHVTLENIE